MLPGSLLLARALLPACVLLAGCSSLPNSVNPVVWWHGLQGGVIAEQRPPPPGADAPYPKLGSVPPKPAPPDAAAHQRIATALVADRANAQYAAQRNPLPDPGSRTASPALFGGPGPLSPADPNASTARLAASSAPPRPAPGPGAPLGAPLGPPQPASAAAPARPPARAPRTAVQQAPLAAPAPAGAEPAGSAEASSEPPGIPQTPPAPPSIPGLPIAATQPTPPPVAPPAPPPAATPLSGAAAAPVAVAFPPGSAVLPAGQDGPLRQLAARRLGHPIEVVGYGEATDAEPQLQSAGVALALSRARAIAAVLTGAGVPAAAIRMDAQAAGRGAAARLLD
ncbi:MAG: hypothetical protein JO209_05970 [Acidisphaera sp.]|nr:hypothetical protein [Acidisphaera sp.]